MVADRIFNDTGIKIVSYPSFPEKSLLQLFPDTEDYIFFVFSEYVKIVAYILRYYL